MFLKLANNSNAPANLSNTMGLDKVCCICPNLLWSTLQRTNLSRYSSWVYKGPFSSQKKGTPLLTNGLNNSITSLTLWSIISILACTVSSILCFITSFLASEIIETLFGMPYLSVCSYDKLLRKLGAFWATPTNHLCNYPFTFETFFLATSNASSWSTMKFK